MKIRQQKFHRTVINDATVKYYSDLVAKSLEKAVQENDSWDEQETIVLDFIEHLLRDQDSSEDRKELLIDLIGILENKLQQEQ